MSLVVQDLGIDLDGRRVVDGVSFEVPDGGRVGLIGESGSGKSLTALALLGLLPDGATASGSIRWHDREIVGLGDREMARLRGDDIGIVFQDPRTALNPIRTVGRQIGEGSASTSTPRGGCRGTRGRRGGPRAPPRSGADRAAVSAPALRRTAAAGRDRDGAGLAPAPADRGPSRPPPWTSRSRPRSSTCCAVSSPSRACRSCSSPTTSRCLAQIATHAVVLAHGHVVERGPVPQLLSAPEHPVTRALLRDATATLWRPSPTDEHPASGGAR